MFRVAGRLPREFGSWYTFWEAATAIYAMCIRQGKGGYWDGLGESIIRSSGGTIFRTEFLVRRSRKHIRGDGQSPAGPCRSGIVSGLPLVMLLP